MAIESPEEVKAAVEQTRIVEVLAGLDGATSATVAEAIEISDSTVRRHLNVLLERGHVIREGQGKRGDPFRWQAADAEKDGSFARPRPNCSKHRALCSPVRTCASSASSAAPWTPSSGRCRSCSSPATRGRWSRLPTTWRSSTNACTTAARVFADSKSHLGAAGAPRSSAMP